MNHSSVKRPVFPTVLLSYVKYQCEGSECYQRAKLELYSGVKNPLSVGPWDKLNFRQDKHIFSPNVLQASKKFSASL